jgi:8-oxo-dGTP pyrophosphatase MutT (NUDIX family)
MDRARLNPDTIARALALGPAAPSSDYDLNPEITAALPPGRRLRPAGVLVPLVERGAGLSVVLTRRAARLRNHGGQIALPGGRVDPTDASVADAALREAEEEIGLPRSAVAVIGALPEHETVTGFAVTPVIGHVTATFEPRPEPAEVAEVFEVPLGFLIDPANLQIHGRVWQGRERRYYAIPYGPHYIWGATARVLKALADRLGPL